MMVGSACAVVSGGMQSMSSCQRFTTSAARSSGERSFTALESVCVADSRSGRSFIASWGCLNIGDGEQEVVSKGIHMGIQFLPHSASDSLQCAGGLAWWGTKRSFEGCCYEFVVILEPWLGRGWRAGTRHGLVLLGL